MTGTKAITELPKSDLSALVKWSKLAGDAVGPYERRDVGLLATMVYWRNRTLDLASVYLAKQTETRPNHWEQLADDLEERGFLVQTRVDHLDRRSFQVTIPSKPTTQSNVEQKNARSADR